MTDTKPETPRPETDSERDKNLAEAKRSLAEAAKFEAEAAIALAQAEKAQHEAVESRIKREKADYARLQELSGDEFNHVYKFIGAVDNASAKKCMDQLSFWDRTEEPGELEIVFFSPGGGVFAGMSLFDDILEKRRNGWKIQTTAKGYAASMGGILVQAGDVRAIGRESFLHIHEVAAGASGKTSDIEDEVALMKKMESRVVDIFASRSKLSKTTIRNKMKRHEWWMTSSEALRDGLVDKIV